MVTVPIPTGAVRIPVPDTLQQTDWTCGAASVRAICGYFGCGASTERQYRLDMGIPRAGADPEHLMWGLVRYGLDFRAYCPMSVEQLQASVRRGRPVLLMLQAWGVDKRTNQYRKSYQGIWQDGHWVVAIGSDRKGVYFEDPSINGYRGFLDYAALEERWHDWGPRYEQVYNFGISVWQSRQGLRPGRRGNAERYTPIG
jgi:predicted double-glycine peptidase